MTSTGQESRRACHTAGGTLSAILASDTFWPSEVTLGQWRLQLAKSSRPHRSPVATPAQPFSGNSNLRFLSYRGHGSTPFRGEFLGQSAHSTRSFWSATCSSLPCSPAGSGSVSTARPPGAAQLSLSHRHRVTQLAAGLGFMVTKAGIHYLIRLVLLRLPDQRGMEPDRQTD